MVHEIFFYLKFFQPLTSVKWARHDDHGGALQKQGTEFRRIIISRLFSGGQKRGKWEEEEGRWQGKRAILFQNKENGVGEEERKARNGVTHL